MKKTILIVVIVLLLLLNIFQFMWDHLANRLPTNAVPDERTALAIAKAVLSATFDDEMDMSTYEVAYWAKKKMWWVGKSTPEGYLGGGMVIVIRERDGKVMEIYASI